MKTQTLDILGLKFPVAKVPAELIAANNKLIEAENRLNESRDFTSRISKHRRLIKAIDEIVCAGYMSKSDFVNIVAGIVPTVDTLQVKHIWSFFAHYDEDTLKAVEQAAKVLSEYNKPKAK